MGTRLLGYREYKKATAAATTHTQSFDQIEEDHKVYVDLVGLKTDKAGADCQVYLVSGGQELLLTSVVGLAASVDYIRSVETWLYASELLRFKWSDIASADTLEMWAIGVDKWPVDGN